MHLSVSLLCAVLSQPFRETEVLDHRALPQNEIPEPLYLCLMIIIKDYKGLFNAHR